VSFNLITDVILFTHHLFTLNSERTKSLSPPSFSFVVFLLVFLAVFLTVFFVVFLVDFLAAVERLRLLRDDEALLLPRVERERALVAALRLRLRDVVRLTAVLRRPVVSCSLDVLLVPEVDSWPLVPAAACNEAAELVVVAAAGLAATADDWSADEGPPGCCCCCCCCCLEMVGGILVCFLALQVCDFTPAAERFVTGLPRFATVVDLALLAPVDS